MLHRKAEERAGLQDRRGTGDSLLHGRRFDRLDLGGAPLHTKGQGVRYFTHAEDAGAVDGILGPQYHVVVGNPPYITPKERR